MGKSQASKSYCAKPSELPHGKEHPMQAKMSHADDEREGRELAEWRAVGWVWCVFRSGEIRVNAASGLTVPVFSVPIYRDPTLYKVCH